MLKGAHIQTTIMVEIPFVFSVWISRSLRILYLILICLFKSLFCWITQFLWQKIISSAVNFFGVHLAHFSPAESFDHQKEEITTTPLWRSIKQLDPILLMQTFTAFTSRTCWVRAVFPDLHQLKGQRGSGNENYLSFITFHCPEYCT